MSWINMSIRTLNGMIWDRQAFVTQKSIQSPNECPIGSKVKSANIHEPLNNPSLNLSFHAAVDYTIDWVILCVNADDIGDPTALSNNNF